jgi:hypothetical protein
MIIQPSDLAIAGGMCFAVAAGDRVVVKIRSGITYLHTRWNERGEFSDWVQEDRAREWDRQPAAIAAIRSRMPAMPALPSRPRRPVKQAPPTQAEVAAAAARRAAAYADITGEFPAIVTEPETSRIIRAAVTDIPAIEAPVKITITASQPEPAPAKQPFALAPTRDFGSCDEWIADMQRRVREANVRRVGAARVIEYETHQMAAIGS